MSTSVTPEPQASMTVRTVSGDGKAPKRRIGTPFAALTAYYQARDIERKRDVRFGAILGIYSGFPPVPPDVMEQQGMGDLPNVNTRQFESKVNTYVGNWTQINAAGSEWAEVRADFPDDPMEEERRSKYLSKCFNDAIKKWDNTEFSNGAQYIINSAVRDTQMGLYGIGVAFFCDNIDFRWKPIPTRKVLVPEGTLLTLDNCPVLFIEDEMSVPDFYAMRNKPGWNEKAVLSILYLQTNKTSQTTGKQFTYSEWIAYIRDNDTWQYSDFPPVRFVHVFTKEFSDNANESDITHSIVCDMVPPATASDKEKELTEGAQGWIYDKEKVAKKWSQVLSVFSDNAGPEGKWHGVKGYGDLIFDGCHFGNLMFNRTATSAIVNNSVMFNCSNEGERQKMQQFKFTPFGVLNPGLTLEQVKVSVDLKSALEVFNLNTNLINQNSRTFPQNDTTTGGEKPTATQVNYDRADQAQFTNLQVSFYRATGLDCMFAEMYRRLAQPASKYPDSWPGGHIAKEFREQAKKYGIEDADLLKVRFVRASRQVGSGNMGLDVYKSDQALSVATPGRGQLNARKLKIQALYGCDMVPALIEEEVPPPNFEDVQIDNENLAIQGGQTPMAFGFQPHEKHLGVGLPTGHITLLQQLEEAANGLMEQGVENNLPAAEKLHSALLAGIEHSGQHVAFMAELPRTQGRPALFEEQVKELNKALNDFSQFAETLGEAIQTAAQTQQPQQMNGASPEQMKAAADIETQRMKTQADLENKRMQTLAKIENDQIKTAAKTEQQRASHEVSLGLDAERRAFELESDAARTEQELTASAARTAIDLQKNAELGQQKIDQAKKNGTKK